MRKLIFLLIIIFCNQSFSQITWNLPAKVLSPDGYITKVALNSLGQAVTVWIEGVNDRVQSKYLSDAGNTWLTPDTGLFLSDSAFSNDEPRIVINDSSQAIAVWNQNDVVQGRYSIDGGKNWFIPTTGINISGAGSQFQEISLNNLGHAVVIYSDGAFTIRIKYSSDGGKSWNSPAVDIGNGGMNPKIVINNSDQVVAVWRAFPGALTPIQTKYSSDGGINWSAAATNISVNINSQPDLVLNNLGHSVAIWRDLVGQIQTNYSTNGGITWNGLGTNIGITGTSYDITINDSDQVAMITNPASISTIRYSTDGGISWSIPSEGGAFGGANDPLNIKMNYLGQVIATWHGTVPQDTIAVYSVDGGINWSVNYNLSSTTGGGDDTFVAINDSSQVIVTWNASSLNQNFALNSFFPPVFLVNSLGKTTQFFLQYDNTNQFSWNSIPEATIYLIYKDSISPSNLLATLPSNVLFYTDHSIKKGIPNTYVIVWVNSQGSLINPTTITLQ